MGNIFKLFGIGSLLIFSFFYVNKTNSYLVSESDLLKIIEANKDMYEVSPVNAYVYGEYIVPGINGSSVNILESYYALSPYDVFNEYFLVYDEVIPNISINGNIDKYIEKGNSVKRYVSFIFENNIEIESYLIKNSIKGSKLIKYTDYLVNANFELINNDIVNFTKLGKLINNNICIVNDENEKLCKENNYYLVKPTEIINNENYLNIKNNIYSGEIIYIDNNLELEYFESLYKEVLFRGYEIVYLSSLISE